MCQNSLFIEMRVSTHPPTNFNLIHLKNKNDYILKESSQHLIRHRIRKNHCRLERLGLFKIHHGIRHNDYNISGLSLTGSRSVQANHSRATFALDNIRLKTFSVIIIHDRDLLVRDQISGVQQILVDSDATDIV